MNQNKDVIFIKRCRHCKNKQETWVEKEDQDNCFIWLRCKKCNECYVFDLKDLKNKKNF